MISVFHTGPQLCVHVCSCSLIRVTAATVSISNPILITGLIMVFLFRYQHLRSSHHLGPLFSLSSVSHDQTFRLTGRQHDVEGSIDARMLSHKCILGVCVCVCVYSCRGAQVQASHLFFCFHHGKQHLFREDVHVPFWITKLGLKSTCAVKSS